MIKWIADIGSNFNGNPQRAFDLIDKAKEAGCWGAKFQLFKPDLYESNRIDERIQLKRWALPEGFIPKLKEHCFEIDIQFGCTPFNLEAVDILAPYVDFFKIGSYELLWLELIRKAAQTNKPLIISTGMATHNEIWAALRTTGWRRVMKNPDEISLLHCNSTYPAKPEECELYKIKEYSFMFNKTIGWSDHTRSTGVIYKAIEAGAQIIEFHLDLEDGQGWEYQIGHCWKPSEIGEVIKQVYLGVEAYKYRVLDLTDLRSQRTDPRDGMRPMKEVRQ